MARQKPVNLAAGLAAAPEPQDAREELDDYASSESLERILTESGAAFDQASVHVYRIEPDSSDEPKIWRGSTEDYNLETLAKKFGSGKYRIKLYGPHPVSGKHALLMNQVATCLLAPEEDARIRALREGRALPGEAPALTADSVRSIVAEAMRAAAPAQAPLQGLREMAEIVKIMLPAREAPVAPAPAPLDPLSMIRTLAGVMRDMQGDREPIEGGRNASGMDVILRLVDRFAPMYAETLKAQQPDATAALPAPGQPVPAQPHQPHQPHQPASVEDQTVLRLKMGLAFLVEQAKDDNDPATYASVIVDNVPPADLKTMLAAPEWIEQLARFEPRVAEHRKWFAELKEEVTAEIAEREQAAAAGSSAPA